MSLTSWSKFVGGRTILRKLIFLLAAFVIDGTAAAQPMNGGADAAGTAPLPQPPTESSALAGSGLPPAAPTCPGKIPALTQVELALDVALGSKISQTGQVFPLHLAEPIVIDGCELAPAGATGEGEVIHAKRAGAGGSSGELVLAARYVMVNGSRLQLRSMQIGTAGKDNLKTASAAASVVGVFAFAITGKNAEYPQGTRAVAKTRADFPLAGVPADKAPAAAGLAEVPTEQAQPPETTTGQAK